MQKKIYVKNLDFQVTESELSDHCSQFGAVAFVKIIKDHETQRSRGFGFVTFEESEAADLAITNLNKTDLNGRILHVEEAIDRRNTVMRMNS